MSPYSILFGIPLARSLVKSCSSRLLGLPLHTPCSVVISRASIYFLEVYQRLGIKLAMSTAYHPQTDSQTECINQELEGYLRNFTSHHQDNWDCQGTLVVVPTLAKFVCVP
jgi:hypothetical protein